MRQKTYYSKDEIITDLYTYGSEFMTTDKKEYIGLYHIYTTGEAYTEPTWNYKLSKKLINLPKTNPETQLYSQKNPITLKYNTPKFIKPNVTAEQYPTGILTRYFLKNIMINRIIEVDYSQIELYDNKLIDPILYIKLSLPWKFTGNTESVIINGISHRGILEHNKTVLDKAEFVMPGISLYLTDLLEYYTPTISTIPPDINSK